MVRQPPGDDQATMTPGKAHPGAADGRSVATAARPNDLWDVIVVGAGPAGLTAARVAAEAGARTLVLERAAHPRYKTCGGGLLGTSKAAVGAGAQVREHATVRAVEAAGAAGSGAVEPGAVVRLVDGTRLDARVVV